VHNKHIAIVGGGIAGLYAAFRLRQHDKEVSITLYEANARIGGRIDTAEFAIYRKPTNAPAPGQTPTQPIQMKAELGAMRFPSQHKLLLSLCNELGIPNVDKSAMPYAWQGPFELKSLYHLRGRTLSDEDFQRGESPYRVRPEERGKTPADLLVYAIFRMLDTMIHDYAHKPGPAGDKDLAFLKDFRRRLMDQEVVSAHHWLTFAKNDYRFAGVPVRNIGFWNVLKHFLSSEAFLLVHDGFGFLSVISNWNALEAFKWLLTDFSPHLRLQTVPGGLGQVPKALERDIKKNGVTIRTAHIVREVRWLRSEKKFQLRSHSKDDAAAQTESSDETHLFDRVILALPPSALRRIRLFDGDSELRAGVEHDWRKLVHCSRPHRLAKIVLAYEEPWWQHTAVPHAQSGRLFTDLPMRQIYYFGPRWLAENGWGNEAPGLSLVMVYNDSHYEAFWRTFHVHDKVHRAMATDHEADAEDTLGLRPERIRGGPLHFWGPDKTSQLPVDKQLASHEQLEAIDARTHVDKYEVRHRMEEKVRAQLSELHGYEVPMAIGGVYRDWSDDGGWHTWEPFVDVALVKDVIRQPFFESDSGMAVRPCERRSDDSDVPLYICGEAYAWEQGWIEGALMTAEAVVRAIVRDKYAKPERYNETPDDFEEYMCAELPREKQLETIEKHESERKRRAARS